MIDSSFPRAATPAGNIARQRLAGHLSQHACLQVVGTMSTYESRFSTNALCVD